MSKVITSPVEQFPGTVTLASPLNFPQLVALMDAVEARDADANPLHRGMLILPGILAVVEKWELAGTPANPTLTTFPSTPLLPVARLIGWLTGEAMALLDEASDPNA